MRFERNSFPGALVGEVFLDGEKITHVTAFDVAERWLERLRHGADGKLAWDVEAQDFVRERIEGAVTFTWRDAAAHAAARAFFKRERIAQAAGEI